MQLAPHDIRIDVDNVWVGPQIRWCGRPRQEWASVHMMSLRITEFWLGSLAFTGREGGHAPLRWTSRPQVCAPMSGPSVPSYAAMPRLGATPMALQLRWGPNTAWVADQYGVPPPSGSGVVCGGSKSAPGSASGMADAVLAANERCVLAPSGVIMGPTGEEYVRENSSFRKIVIEGFE